MIDSHHHLWELSRGPYEFPRPGDPLLYRDVLPAEIEQTCRDAGVAATVVVQTSAALWETEYLLGVAAASPVIAGVVGWCDLGAADVGATLDRLQSLGPLVGIRPMLQRYDDVGFMLSDAVAAGLEQVAQRGLAFDALVDARHLATIDALAARHPGLSIVIDHMAKPWRPPHQFAAWTAGMQTLAQHPNCSVKVSGFPFDAKPDAPWHDYAGLCATLHGWFGRERLLWGTDWPLLLRHANYRHAVTALRPAFPPADLDLIGGGNASRIYRLAL